MAEYGLRCMDQNNKITFDSTRYNAVAVWEGLVSYNQTINLTAYTTKVLAQLECSDLDERRYGLPQNHNTIFNPPTITVTYTSGYPQVSIGSEPTLVGDFSNLSHSSKMYLRVFSIGIPI